jgi:hypothetical protein
MSAGVVAAVEQAHRREWARVFAATARLTRSLDLAEECTQDAYAFRPGRRSGSMSTRGITTGRRFGW